MAHIFISYSKQDIEFARYLKMLLEAQQLTVWMDEEQLAASARWWRTIEDSIDSCAGLVVIMSPNAAESDWVERELLRAEKMKRPIFPVLLAGEAWSRLANLQYADLRTGLRATLPLDLITGLKRVCGISAQPTGIALQVENGNVLTFEADALALKFAQAFYGADHTIAKHLVNQGGFASNLVMPAVGSHTLIAANGLLNVKDILWVGMPNLHAFDYRNIRELAQGALRILAQERPLTTHLAMTIHGVGFGLDEAEAVRAQVAGFSEAIALGQMPPALRRITIVDIDEERVERLRAILDEALRDRDDFTPLGEGWGYLMLPPAADCTPISQEKAPPYAYVALPNDPAMEDVFYYGIQGAIHAAGLLCVRVEGDPNDTEVIDQSLHRLRDAALVIAEVSDPLYSTYVQIGYALGKGCPIIAVMRSADSLYWPVAHRLVYTSIKGLERQIAALLPELGLA